MGMGVAIGLILQVAGSYPEQGLTVRRACLRAVLIRPERATTNAGHDLTIDRGKHATTVKEWDPPIEGARARAIRAGVSRALRSAQRAESSIVQVTEEVIRVIDREIYQAAPHRGSLIRG